MVAAVVYEGSYANANAAAMFHPKYANLDHLSVLAAAERDDVLRALVDLVTTEVMNGARQRGEALGEDDAGIVRTMVQRLHNWTKNATEHKDKAPLKFWK